MYGDSSPGKINYTALEAVSQAGDIVSPAFLLVYWSITHIYKCNNYGSTNRSPLIVDSEL